MAKLTVNEKALRLVPDTVTYDHPMLAFYKPYIEAWLADRAGEKPTAAMLMVGTLTKKRGAGAEAAAVALGLREGGYNIDQLRVGFKCGPAHNHTDTLVTLNRKGGQGAGYFDRAKGDSGQGAARQFSLTFTPKGEQWLNDTLIAYGLKAAPKVKTPAKAAGKPKGKGKGRKATTVAPAETPAGEAPEVTEGHVAEMPHTEVTPDAVAALAAHFNS